MDYCRICTQHYISTYVLRCEQIYIPYIVIASGMNLYHLYDPLYVPSDPGDRFVQPFLQHYESPQKSSWCIVTFLKEDGSMKQAIWHQHDQKLTLAHCL
jgi:hypothetical protein